MLTCHPDRIGFLFAAAQVQNILLSIMCGSACVILLLGVMTRFVMEAQQARLMWCVTRGRVCIYIMRLPEPQLARLLPGGCCSECSDLGSSWRYSVVVQSPKQNCDCTTRLQRFEEGCCMQC